ncbi:response regulator transcription factor [Beggiatoa leptomitoformis]|nr:response regulator [Beggiatoa leptomitoformis]
MNSDFVVYVVDDDKPILKAVEYVLTKEGFNTELFASTDEFLNHYIAEKMGCLFLDVNMPDMNGLEFQKILKKQEIEIPVVMMTAHGNIPMAVSALKAGALDFVEKPFNTEKLVSCVKECLEYCLSHFSLDIQRHNTTLLLKKLTSREQEVMNYLCEGCTSKEIGNLLNISSRTAEHHRMILMHKLQVKSVIELVKLVEIVK